MLLEETYRLSQGRRCVRKKALAKLHRQSCVCDLDKGEKSFAQDNLEKLNGNFVSEEWMVHLIYIVAKGMPITTEECAGKCGEGVETLRPSQLIEHQATKTSSNVFFLSEDFKTRYPAALKALNNCVKLQDSKWTIKRGDPSRADGKKLHTV